MEAKIIVVENCDDDAKSIQRMQWGDLSPLLGAPIIVLPYMPKEPKFQFGQKLRDDISGFEGKMTAHIRHITGCDTYAVQPPVDKDGKLPEARSFDESRLVLVDEGTDIPQDDDTRKNGAGEVSLETTSDLTV